MWIKISFVFGLSLILYHFQLLSQYDIFEIIQTQTLYLDPYDFKFICQYNTNINNKWSLPLFNQTHNNTLIFDRIVLNDSITKLENIPISKSVLFSTVIDNKHALFCSNGYKPDGTGNALAIYWTARAMAFFMNYTFIFDANCRYRKFKMFDQITYPRVKWTWFLDTYYNITLNNICINDNINITSTAFKYNYIWKYYANYQRKKTYDIPYRSYLMFLIYNPWFINIVQHDTKNAFQRYYSHAKIPVLYNDSNQLQIDSYSMDTNIGFYQSIMNDLNNINQHIILIHIRCGDILFHRSRYLLNIKYFKTALQMIFNYINEYDNINKFYKFKVLSQLSASNAHSKTDILALNMSNTVVNYMCKKIREYINTIAINNLEYSFEIIGNDTADNDYFQMATTRYLICSPSAFCLNAAIANYYDPKLIIIPKDGVWKKQYKTYVQMSSGILDHYKWLNTSYMYRKIKHIFHPDLTFPQGLLRFKKWFKGGAISVVKKRNNGTLIINDKKVVNVTLQRELHKKIVERNRRAIEMILRKNEN